MNTSTIRQYKLANYRSHKTLVGERNGFKRYLCFRTVDRYIESQAPNQSRFSEMSCGMNVSFAVEKGGIWIVWQPGWGVDQHWPADAAPEYLRETSDNKCEFIGGPCKCDGSSLADGERFWPAFNAGGPDEVFAALQEWFRDPDEDE